MPAGVAGCHQAGGQRHTAAAEVHTALAEGGRAVQKVLLLLVLAGVGTVQHLLLLLLQKSQQLLDSPVRCPCCWCCVVKNKRVHIESVRCNAWLTCPTWMLSNSRQLTPQ
jgi:hypothetical protein